MSEVRRVEIPQLPDSIEGFVVLRNDVAITPQGGAAMMVVALQLCTQDETLGRQCLTASIERRQLVEGPKGWKGVQLRNRDLALLERQLQTHPYLPTTYFVGTSASNGYELPAPPYAVECSDNMYSGRKGSGSHKVFVTCSGAASARPVTLVENQNGVWKASEWSSLIVGVRSPAEPAEDDL
jgi:hypothetical protein